MKRLVQNVDAYESAYVADDNVIQPRRKIQKNVQDTKESSAITTTDVVIDHQKIFIDIFRRGYDKRNQPDVIPRKWEQEGRSPVLELWTHGGCMDGTGAATCFVLFHKVFEALFPNQSTSVAVVTLNHGHPVPSIKNKIVVMFDFCFNEATTRTLLEEADWLMIYDHHEGAAKEISQQFPLNCVFDNDLSGVGLAWKHFFGSTTNMPTWTIAVQDRDLWKFQYEYTKAFCTALYHIVPLHAQKWFDYFYPAVNISHRNMTLLECVKHWEDACVVPCETLIQSGKSMILIQESIATAAAKRCLRAPFCSIRSIIINTDVAISEVAEKALELFPDEKMVVVWRFDPYSKQYKVSLRSRTLDSVTNCFEIARLFGGNGHQAAAGFKLDGEGTAMLDFFKTNMNKKEP